MKILQFISALGFLFVLLVQVNGNRLDEKNIPTRSSKRHEKYKNHKLQEGARTEPELLKFDRRALNDGENKTSTTGNTTPTSETEKDVERSPNFSLVFLLILVVLGYMIRRRLNDNTLNSGRWINGAIPLPTEDFDEDEMINYRKQEMVEMISTQDDWEWDDDARNDLEQGLSSRTNVHAQQDKSHSKPENEVLHKLRNSSSLELRNRALSSGSNTGNTDLSAASTKSISSVQRSNISKSKIDHPVQVNDNDNDADHENLNDEDDWDDNPLSSFPTQSAVVLSAPSNVSVNTNKSSPSPPSIEDLLKEQELRGNIPIISSLGERASKIRSYPVPKKKENGAEEEDIFASMGLSAVPKTSTKKQTHSSTHPNSNMKVSKSSYIPSSSSLGSVTANVIAKPYVESEDVGSDWGDDSDLNDLLED